MCPQPEKNERNHHETQDPHTLVRVFFRIVCAVKQSYVVQSTHRSGRGRHERSAGDFRGSARPAAESLVGTVSVASLLHKVPKPAKKAFDRGSKALEKGDVEKAAKGFENAIALDPEYAAAHRELGVSYFRMNRLEEAEAQLREATALDPYVSVAQSNFAWVLFHARNFPEAEQHAGRALALSSRNDRARALLGILLASSPATGAEGERQLEQDVRTLPGLDRVLEASRSWPQ